MEILSFDTHPCERVLTSLKYFEADKHLSFSIKNEDEEDVMAYVALKKENLCNKEHGCRVLDLYINQFTIPLYDKMFEEIIARITIWRNDGKPSFDYMWFYLKDMENPCWQNFISCYKDFEVLKGIAYYQIR